MNKRENSIQLRRQNLHLKYEKAVTLYANTDMPLKKIAEECQVSAGGLGNYLRRYWRELMLRRHRMPMEGKLPHEVKVIEPGKQNIVAHAKYKEAIAACDSFADIDLNISQIAHKYGIDGPALANFMRIHYPDILVWREKVRQRLGLQDNAQRGARPECMKQYAQAVELYRTTGMTVPEIADLCQVSPGGLSQHLRFYHTDVLKQKRQKREKQQEAKQQASSQRDEHVKLRKKRVRNQTATLKYAKAIESMKLHPRPIAKVAEEFGLHPDTFRAYLHKHEPELARQQGMEKVRNGKRMSYRSREKYAEAIRLYETTPENLKSIAARLGITYNSIGGYIRRNYPEVIAAHQALLQKES